MPADTRARAKSPTGDKLKFSYPKEITFLLPNYQLILSNGNPIEGKGSCCSLHNNTMDTCAN